MNPAQVDFRSLPWVSIGPGAREKRSVQSNFVIRLLELSPPFVEEHWCVKEHIGYVLDGECSIQFHDRTERLRTGDGIAVEGGSANAHKAIVQRAVLLFLVEPQSDGEQSGERANWKWSGNERG